MYIYIKFLISLFIELFYIQHIKLRLQAFSGYGRGIL